ncbi:serine/threonine protein kinase [Sporosarcina limicola]|uniref:Serine/threonine protein kinase n=1 Tax=Sporosarcina limicola TaxID=34101 RepID=A0A927MRC9_9BACL|nr:serine/threonine-protein kinase [Sporosarcina limicola]MBE1555956.1 serine/threonine protein kinase [Sporosarcina limicola]
MVTIQDGISLKENTLLKNIYKVNKVISRSELSIVYIGENIKTKETQVIKEYFPRKLALRDLDHQTIISRLPSTKKKYADWMQIFLDEALVLKELTHGNIVQYHDHFEENGSAYIIMAYCEGKLLDQYIKENQWDYSSDFFYKTLIPLIEAVGYIHKKGIIHRDIKPSNIMIDNEGNPRILDFGSAVYYKKVEGHTIFTTSGYSPLELYSASSKQGVSSDIYSLAATFYYSLSGVAPLDISKRIIEDRMESVRKHNPKVSPIMSGIIMWGLAIQPSKRCFSLHFFTISILLESVIIKMEKWMKRLNRNSK